VIGSGLEAAPSTERPNSTVDVARPFVLYLGRIDPNKGCETLLRHFVKWSDRSQSAVQLVMAGPANMPVREHPRIKRVGYVSDADRESLLATASVLIVPSPYESLSMVLLEAWNHGLPALVNGRCSVLKGQTLRANGGLYYRSFDEFAHGLDYLLQHPDAARRLGEQGRAYIDREYRWPRVIGRLESFLESLPRSDSASRAGAVAARHP
jgi:glycosyltransferase involved in cell wall biosynthesis